MKSAITPYLYLLFGWHDGDTISEAKLFGVFSSVEAADRLRDTYYYLAGFQLQRVLLDEEIVPVLPEESRTVYTVVRDRDGYRKWRPATTHDLITRSTP